MLGTQFGLAYLASDVRGRVSTTMSRSGTFCVASPASAK
jgi:hypothetical protein